MTRELMPAIHIALTGAAAAEIHSSKIATSSVALIAVAGRLYHLSTDLSWFRSTDHTYAIGSGAEYALGALAAGADIRKALKVAHRHDTYTGPDHQVATADELLMRTGVTA